MARKSPNPPRDRELAAIAARQHGVVALSQVMALGLGASGVRRRVALGRLHGIHRGVYAVGHPILKTHGRWLAAVLACGPGSVLSHRSAAALWDLRGSDRARVDVTVPSRGGRSRPGIDVHRSCTLEPADTTTHDGIPCTTVARTLLDLADVVDRRALRRAVERAEMLHLFDLKAIEDVLRRAAGRRGASTLHSLLTEDRITETGARNELEHRFLEICRDAGLPDPQVNVPLGPFVADFHWPRHKLVAETDGYETHGTRAAFESDRERDQYLMRAGYRVIRFTWRQLAEQPHEVARTLEQLLA